MDLEELQTWQQGWIGEVWLELLCEDCGTHAWLLSSPSLRREDWAARCKVCGVTTLHSEVRRRPVAFPG